MSALSNKKKSNGRRNAISRTSLLDSTQNHAALIEQAIEVLDAQKPAVSLALQLADLLKVAVNALKVVAGGEHPNKMRRVAAAALAQIEPP